MSEKTATVTPFPTETLNSADARRLYDATLQERIESNFTHENVVKRATKKADVVTGKALSESFAGMSASEIVLHCLGEQ